ncbi:MAG: trypsin-like peptidase domain-containing protein, partial [Bacteroidaceae bacterium]|nr:trypsin-like peptidase domain-containing protein [Bacteroidaceae bacterium]
MALTAATLVVNPSTGNTVSCAILARNVQFDDVENLTEKARNGKTRYMCNGSGFFVTADGDVVTNHHVVDGAEEVVVLWQGTAYRMRVVASDKERDLALLHPDEVKDDFSMDNSF